MSFSRLALLLVISLRASAAFAYPQAYRTPELDDLAFDSESPTVVDADGRRITIQMSRLHADLQVWNSYPKDEVTGEIVAHWRILRAYLSRAGISDQDCRMDYNLNLFVVPASMLMSRARFQSIYTANHIPDSQHLLGYYDPTLAVDRNSMIVLSDTTPAGNRSLLAHELTHYWWDRLCLAGFLSDGEKFAQKIEASFVASH